MVMESPTAAIDPGLLSHAGVGFGLGLPRCTFVPEGPGEFPPTASQPASPTTAADTTASKASER
ncbi:hypothetical protein Stsp02_70820 [Streptomyces sp. NBRC 14336]|nr:hypothetical protein Stsp02_70820 [Streptomyces sp. NBRC 14336]